MPTSQDNLAAGLRAERDLVRARLAASNGDSGAAAAYAAAISSLREQSTPYHLAHGLLDQAGYLANHGDAEAAAQAIDEARAIGRRLRCQPLLDRADAVQDAEVPDAGPAVTPPAPEESVASSDPAPAADDSGKGAARARYRDALRHRDMRLLVGTFLVDQVGSWSFFVVISVYIFDRTHSTQWLAATGVCRWAPGLLLASYGGVIADRYQRTTVMTVRRWPARRS